MRLGYPLSPLLFSLTKEPLICAIRESSTMVGFIREDGILVCLGDTNNSLKSCLDIVQRFGAFSEYEVNWDKSVLMPLDRLRNSLTE